MPIKIDKAFTNRFINAIIRDNSFVFVDDAEVITSENLENVVQENIELKQFTKLNEAERYKLYSFTIPKLKEERKKHLLSEFIAFVLANWTLGRNNISEANIEKLVRKSGKLKAHWNLMEIQQFTESQFLKDALSELNKNWLAPERFDIEIPVTLKPDKVSVINIGDCEAINTSFYFKKSCLYLHAGKDQIGEIKIDMHGDNESEKLKIWGTPFDGIKEIALPYAITNYENKKSKRKFIEKVFFVTLKIKFEEDK